MFGCGGLPGGSPGPDAIGTWKTLLFMLIFALTCGGLLLWFWSYAIRLTL